MAAVRLTAIQSAGKLHGFTPQQSAFVINVEEKAFNIQIDGAVQNFSQTANFCYRRENLSHGASGFFSRVWSHALRPITLLEYADVKHCGGNSRGSFITFLLSDKHDLLRSVVFAVFINYYKK